VGGALGHRPPASRLTKADYRCWDLQLGDEQPGPVVGAHSRPTVDEGPMKRAGLVILGQATPDSSAAEHERHDVTGHVLVHAGEGALFDREPGLLENLTTQRFLDGLAVLEDAAGRFPVTVVSPLDEEGSSDVVDDHAGNADECRVSFVIA
jgi:hypothetical protein